MDCDQLVYVLLSDFWEKAPVVFLGSKIFLSRTQLLAKLQGQLQPDFLLLSSFHGQSFACCEWRLGTPLAIAVDHSGLSCLK